MAGAFGSMGGNAPPRDARSLQFMHDSYVATHDFSIGIKNAILSLSLDAWILGLPIMTQTSPVDQPQLERAIRFVLDKIGTVEAIFQSLKRQEWLLGDSPRRDIYMPAVRALRAVLHGPNGSKYAASHKAIDKLILHFVMTVRDNPINEIMTILDEMGILSPTYTFTIVEYDPENVGRMIGLVRIVGRKRTTLPTGHPRRHAALAKDHTARLVKNALTHVSRRIGIRVLIPDHAIPKLHERLRARVSAPVMHKAWRWLSKHNMSGREALIPAEFRLLR